MNAPRRRLCLRLSAWSLAGILAALPAAHAGEAPAAPKQPSLLERAAQTAKKITDPIRELADPSMSTNRILTVHPDGSFQITQIDRAENTKYKKVEYASAYDSADPHYAYNTVIDTGDGHYIRGDGSPATADDHEAYERRRNCAVPSATVVAASWDDTRQGGWYGYDKETQAPTEYRHYGNLAGVHCGSVTRATAMGYQTTLKGEVGSFVAENSLGEKIRVNGARLNASARLIAFEADVKGTATVGPAEIAVHGNTFTGATSEAEMITGVTPEGGVVQVSGKAFVGLKETFDVSATLRGPFGIKLGTRASLEGSLGAGVEGSALLSASWDGHFKVGGKFAAAVGIGSGGSAGVDVDLSNVVTGVDMDDVTLRENTAAIVSSTMKRIEKGEIVLKPGLSMSTFAQDLLRMSDRLTPDDPNNQKAMNELLAKSFQDASLVVKLTGPPAAVTVGTAMQFKATPSGGTPPYSYLWTTSEAKSIREEASAAAYSTMSQRGLTTPGDYWMAVEVMDSSKPKKLKATAKFPVKIVGRFGVELSHQVSPQGGGYRVTVDASIAGGVPPYTVTWGWGGTRYKPTRIKEAHATFNQTVDAKALTSGKTLEALAIVLDSSSPQPQLVQARRAIAIELPPFRATASAPAKAKPESKVTLSVSWTGGEPPYSIAVRASTSGTQTLTKPSAAGFTLGYTMPKKPGTESFAVTVTDKSGRKATAGCAVVVAAEEKAAGYECPKCGCPTGHAQGSPYKSCDDWKNFTDFFAGSLGNKGGSMTVIGDGQPAPKDR